MKLKDVLMDFRFCYKKTAPAFSPLPLLLRLRAAAVCVSVRLRIVLCSAQHGCAAWNVTIALGCDPPSRGNNPLGPTVPLVPNPTQTLQTPLCQHRFEHFAGEVDSVHAKRGLLGPNWRTHRYWAPCGTALRPTARPRLRSPL